jgi:hypothetical protein
MVEKARQRLGKAQNASVAVEDGQALSFPDENFDAVVCTLGLFFPDRVRGLTSVTRAGRLRWRWRSGSAAGGDSRIDNRVRLRDCPAALSSAG